MFSEPSLAMWLVATSPLLLLLALVASGRVKTSTAAFFVLLYSCTVGYFAFGAGGDVLVIAIGKGAWLGVWISFVVAPALLLYQVAIGGGLERVGDVLGRISSSPTERLLIVAWLLPSLIQGIAGFGVPIALTAPLLISMGYKPVKAVIYPLIGYCWSVTFGSMASSFYMVAVTGGQHSSGEQMKLALYASIMLGFLAIVAGSLICVLEGGSRLLVQTVPFLLATGAPVAITLVLTAITVPPLASTTAAGVGILVAALLGRSKQTSIRSSTSGSSSTTVRPSDLFVFLPYAVLLLLALPVLAIPTSRAWVQSHVVLGFNFPETATGLGWVNEAQEKYTGIALLAHPGTFVLLAAIIGYFIYRKLHLWSGPDFAGVTSTWVRSIPRSITPIILLTTLSAILVDTGMTTTISGGLVTSLGGAYPTFSPLVGALGSFVTGSSTSSNALLGAMQAEAANLLGIQPAKLLAAQTAGANIGNSVAPMVIAVGTSTLGSFQENPLILRLLFIPVVVLLVLLSAMVTALVFFS